MLNGCPGKKEKERRKEEIGLETETVVRPTPSPTHLLCNLVLKFHNFLVQKKRIIACTCRGKQSENTNQSKRHWLQHKDLGDEDNYNSLRIFVVF
ncbi:hypothetical protein L1887_33005 [Cichorium endivia]|nr:hypothetical protein L1887_33005 [Cichorium endivia]